MGRSYASTGSYNPVSYNSGSQNFLVPARPPPDYDMHSYDDCYSRWRGQFRVELVF